MQPAIDVRSHMPDRYPRMQFVVAHGGGTLPFLAPRLDRRIESTADSRPVASERASAYLRRLHADSALFPVGTPKLTRTTAGEDRVVYGADFPHGPSGMAGTLDAPPRDEVRGANAERPFGIVRAPRAP